jgi:ketosteroid isomerase-like protein
MTLRIAVVVLCASTLTVSHGQQGVAAGDLAGLSKFEQQSVAATLSRNPAELTALWLDDAVRLSQGQPAAIGKKAIQESYERWAAVPGIRVLTYVPETKDVTILDGWAIEWGYATGSYVESSGDTKQILTARLILLKKMSDGSWRCFRGIGGPAFTAPVPGQSIQTPAASRGSTNGGSAADRAAIDALRRLDIDSTIARDPVALTASYTDDAVRIFPVPPAEVGKSVIFASNQRQTANKDFKVLKYVHELQDLTFFADGWAAEWRHYAGSFTASAGAAPIDVRGTVLIIYKKLPDGSWKCFRGMGI